MQEKDYDECVTMIRDKTINRMKFVWEVELDKVYDDAKTESRKVVTPAEG